MLQCPRGYVGAIRYLVKQADWRLNNMHRCYNIVLEMLIAEDKLLFTLDLSAMYFFCFKSKIWIITLSHV